VSIKDYFMTTVMHHFSKLLDLGTESAPSGFTIDYHMWQLRQVKAELVIHLLTSAPAR
jgi:hypothetical protein